MSHLDESVMTEPEQAADAQAENETVADDELLIEEISIDGMCGVY